MPETDTNYKRTKPWGLKVRENFFWKKEALETQLEQVVNQHKTRERERERERTTPNHSTLFFV